MSEIINISDNFKINISEVSEIGKIIELKKKQPDVQLYNWF